MTLAEPGQLDDLDQTVLANTQHWPHTDLLLISFVILFFELACIRFFGSMVVFLTFFTNIVLMASFLGMSVGCLASGRRQNFIDWVLPTSFITVLLALVAFFINQKFGKVAFNVGNQASPQLIYFGTEYAPKDPAAFVIPIEIVAGIFFVLISLMFIGLGQVMGRAFDAIPNRLQAYTTNIFGSLLGIVAFFVASGFHTSPHVWFVVVMLIVLYFVSRWSAIQIGSQMGVMFVVAMVAFGVGDKGQTFWSPYYKIRYTPQTGEIDTNNISHQQMIKIEQAGPAYMLPHLLAHDAGRVEPFDDVLIIGAGSGNDVAASLLAGAKHIDAVEIDPVITARGKDDHPDHPFDEVDRVKVYYRDGRRWLRETDKKYDLIVYALVDSLVLHSGFSSLRLENFLFTQQAFEDVKARLKPGGVFAMYNYYRQGWVVTRLAQMARDVFGMEPIIVSLPFQESIGANDNQKNHITFLLVGVPDASKKNPTIDAIRAKFADANSFWINTTPSNNENRNGYSREQPETVQWGTWQKIAPAVVDSAKAMDLPTDNWPFLYLRSAQIPLKPNLMGIGIIAVLSIAILLTFAPVRSIKLNWQMFFLGAGFMLLETKGVVHMALLFGSTWVVNSIVFFAILVMILLANLYVMMVKPTNLKLPYALLGVALLVNTLVPMSAFLALPGGARTVVSGLVIFVPIFFAGVIFAARFSVSDQPDIDMGANIAGVILGGLTENLSMVLGFNYLLIVAIAFYALSYVLKPRSAFPQPA